MTAPPNQVFTSGFLCQLIVGICIMLNVSLLYANSLFHLLLSLLSISPFLFFFFFSFFDTKKITKRELTAVHSNGIVVSCQGMFLGQLLVKIEDQSTSIVVMQMARSPDLGFITSAIHRLVKSNFYQCMLPIYTHTINFSLIDILL